MLAVISVGWENAFRVIAGFMLIVVLPVGLFLLSNRPSDKGLEPFGYEPGETARRRASAIAMSDQTTTSAITPPRTLRFIDAPGALWRRRTMRSV